MTATLRSAGEIVPAQAGDAQDVYQLLVKAFGATYLRFSVYQSPKAVVFVREQVEASLADGRPTFFVVRKDGALAGFYNAVRRGRESFLNYVATSGAVRGTGRRLLEHFEAAAAGECDTLGLDVFRSNTVAFEWYSRRGYQIRSVRYHYRFGLESLMEGSSDRLELDQGLLDGALEAEAFRGFSSLSCVFNGTPVKLGLIGGDVCNLLEPRGPASLAPARAVARSFAGRRRWLLVTSMVSLPEAASAESSEEALYMTRPRLRSGAPA